MDAGLSIDSAAVTADNDDDDFILKLCTSIQFSKVKFTKVLMSIKSLNTSLAQLRSVQDATGLEEALQDVIAASPENNATKMQFIAELQGILDEQTGIALNAKLRRKIKRLQQSLSIEKDKTVAHAGKADLLLEPLAAAMKAETKTLIGETEMDRSLSSVIAAVRESISQGATELEAALAPMKAGMGDCKSRRTLKRVVEQAMTQITIESSMNARIRRRLARVLKILSPGGAESGGIASAAASISKKRKAAEDTSDVLLEQKDSKKRRKVVPYVLFVGQLAFETSPEELEAHFRKHTQLTGDIQARLLSCASSGKPKGIGFVNLDNAADMFQCLTLHHSTLRGRKINVERSCGGSDKHKRAEKLQEKRGAQAQALRDITERVLSDYAAKGLALDKMGAGFRDKLLRMSPAVVAVALQAWERVDSEQRSLAKLDQLLAQHNNNSSS
jgi:hypothetical protein